MSSDCCTPRRPRAAAVRATPARIRAEGHTHALVALSGGTFRMGDDRGEGRALDHEGPARTVDVAGFEIGECAVSNREFGEFVEATGYVTDAERFGWSYVFVSFLTEQARDGAKGHADGAPWWVGVGGATWARPFGPASSIAGLEEHPVVHVSWNDATAFCAWAGGRLPREPEWEFAARGGLEGCRYPWGDELKPNGGWACNIWQGEFPGANTAEDGYEGTAPVRTYAPNGYGLYQTVGNVWEWCADSFDGRSAAGAPRVLRGGSYLCHDSYCNRYRVAARTSNTPDSSGGNLGFRCARDA
jgi:sulfatase modifying factor 1